MKKVITTPKEKISSYRERLIRSGAVDLTDNCNIEDLGNGYCKTIIIDENKLVK